MEKGIYLDNSILEVEVEVVDKVVAVEEVVVEVGRCKACKAYKAL